MSDSQRTRRLAEQIQVIVAGILESKIKDPRLGFITVTEARVTGDLQNATVYYTVLGDEQERADTAAALASAKGLIRSEMGGRLGIRLTPTLTFEEDHVAEHAASLEAKLREVRERDQELKALSEGAQYAAGPDPYKEAANEE